MFCHFVTSVTLGHLWLGQKIEKKTQHICSVRNMGLWDSCPIKIIWKKRLNFASSHNDKDVSNWVFGERPKNFIFLFGTLGQLSQLEIFGSKNPILDKSTQVGPTICVFSTIPLPNG